ncbi:MAG: transcriptional regulator, TetR family [Phenylobacterium sp.]|nr:transcriptional regulator, TetR family [Phenylobacterium sp.]
MSETQPRWRRRKEARPGEILQAALDVFSEKGFARATLDEIARRAGVTKPALYRYFETKEDLFRAVVTGMVRPDFDRIREMASGFPGSFHELVPRLLARAAASIGSSPAPAIVRMVIGESRTFPDLARIWHESLVAPAIGMLAELIERAQARGEVAPGDPRLYAFSLLGPVFMGALSREVFGPVGADVPDLQALAGQHAQVLLHGLTPPPPQPQRQAPT